MLSRQLWSGPLVVALVAAAGLGAACAEPDRASPGTSRWQPLAAGPANLLLNPGFEEGREGWTSLGGVAWGAFEVVEDTSRTGSRSARLHLDWPTGKSGAPVKVFGVVQETTARPFPEVLSGWYRVGRWWSESPKTKLYLQAVVIVWDDPETTRLVTGGKTIAPIRNYQFRHYLAGVAKPPFQLANARGRVVDPAPPRIDEWVRFDLPLRQDFEESWGRIPEGYSSLRVLVEARWDDKPEGAGVQAEVWYDDLHLGDAP